MKKVINNSYKNKYKTLRISAEKKNFSQILKNAKFPGNFLEIVWIEDVYKRQTVSNPSSPKKLCNFV